MNDPKPPLNAVLSAVLGLLEIVREGQLEPQQTAEFLERVQRETERMHRIIRDLLDFAHPKTPPRLWVDLAAISRSARSGARTPGRK